MIRVPAVSATRTPTKRVSLSTIDRQGARLGLSRAASNRGSRSLSIKMLEDQRRGKPALRGQGTIARPRWSARCQRRELGDPQVGASVRDQGQLLEWGRALDRARLRALFLISGQNSSRCPLSPAACVLSCSRSQPDGLTCPRASGRNDTGWSAGRRVSVCSSALSCNGHAPEARPINRITVNQIVGRMTCHPRCGLEITPLAVTTYRKRLIGGCARKARQPLVLPSPSGIIAVRD